MDAPHSLVFCAFAAVALAGALAAVLVEGAAWRVRSLLALAAGLAGLYASLSAGFAAVVVLVAYLGVAAIGLAVTGPDLPRRPPARALQLAGPLAAALLVVLVYAALRADFARGSYPGGFFGAAALGRLLFARDAVAMITLACVMVLAATAVFAARGTGRR